MQQWPEPVLGPACFFWCTEPEWVEVLVNGYRFIGIGSCQAGFDGMNVG